MDTKNLVLTLLDYLINKYESSSETHTPSLISSQPSTLSTSNPQNNEVDLDFSEFPSSPVGHNEENFPLEDILSQIPDFKSPTTNNTPQDSKEDFPQEFGDFNFD